MSKIFTFIGKKGTGKTTAIKKLFPEGMVWDKNNEYIEEGYSSFFNPNIEESLNFAQTLTDENIIIEETSTFLDARSNLPSQIREMCIAARHINIDLALVFHQLSDVPAKAIGYSDIIILFKTSDAPHVVAQKFRNWPRIVSAYEKVMKHENQHAFIIVEK